jgi:HEAT repeat protein
MSMSNDDSLPPVKPPTAGFLLQLFVIPGVIVFIIVMVYVTFNWLAHMDSNPRAYVDVIRRDNAGSWQAASNLANELQRNSKLKQDAGLAGDLASLLKQHVQTGAPPNDHEMDLRVFLCRALGEFQVPTGQPALLLAATSQRGERDITVRRAAIESLAVLVDNLYRAKTKPPDELLTMLLTASRDESSLIRSTSAFTLGVLGSDRSLERLERMLSDSWPDARYNAATGLARHGNVKAVPVLVEMLDPEGAAGVKTEGFELARDYKRASILMNGLRAAGQLSAANSKADLGDLVRAVEKLIQEGRLEARLRLEAENVLRELKKRPAP